MSDLMHIPYAARKRGVVPGRIARFPTTNGRTAIGMVTEIEMRFSIIRVHGKTTGGRALSCPLERLEMIA